MIIESFKHSIQFPTSELDNSAVDRGRTRTDTPTPRVLGSVSGPPPPLSGCGEFMVLVSEHFFSLFSLSTTHDLLKIIGSLCVVCVGSSDSDGYYHSSIQREKKVTTIEIISQVVSQQPHLNYGNEKLTFLTSGLDTTFVANRLYENSEMSMIV